MKRPRTIICPRSIFILPSGLLLQQLRRAVGQLFSEAALAVLEGMLVNSVDHVGRAMPHKLGHVLRRHVQQQTLRRIVVAQVVESEVIYAQLAQHMRPTRGYRIVRHRSVTSRTSHRARIRSVSSWTQYTVRYPTWDFGTLVVRPSVPITAALFGRNHRIRHSTSRSTFLGFS